MRSFIVSAALIDLGKICGFKKYIWIRVDGGYKLVPEGLGNCSFDLLDELCCAKSATKRNLSLTIKKSARNNYY